MATKRYTVDEALEAVFDDDFGHSDECSNDEEEGEDYYAYLGEPVVLPSDVEALTHDVVSGDEDSDDRDDASDNSIPEFDLSDVSSDEEDPLRVTGTCSDNDDKDKTRGFYDYRSNGPLLAAVWFDRRFIYFLSTIHRAESTTPTTVKRRNLDGTQDDITCPPLLPDYQLYMRGVDRGDQMIGCYNVGRRSRKWWKRVWSHLIECLYS